VHNGTGQLLDQPSRLAELDSLGILEKKSDETYNRYTRLLAAHLETDVSLVSIVSPKRQSFLGACGLPEDLKKEGETPIEYSFCRHVVEQGKPFVVNNAEEDPIASKIPRIKAAPVMAYLGVPIHSPQGNILGSFCAIQGSVRNWTDAELAFAQDLVKSLEAELKSIEGISGNLQIISENNKLCFTTFAKYLLYLNEIS